MVEAKKQTTLKMRVAQGTVGGMLLIATPITMMNEGVDLNPYWDKLGRVWTVCYGETAGITQHTPTQTITKCSYMLQVKLKFIGLRVDQMVKPDMTPQCWAALTDFSYNVGLTAFKNSTLLKKINAGDPLAYDQFLRWTFIKDKDCKIATNKCAGLVTRRAGARELCLIKE